MNLQGDFAAGMRRYEPMDEDAFQRNFANLLVWQEGNFASLDFVFLKAASFGDVDAVQK